MVNSQNSHPPSGAILTNLLDADATLASQESEIMGQLEALREKRQSLKTVIDLFSGTPTPTAAPPTAASTNSTPAQPLELDSSPEPNESAPAPESTPRRGRKSTKAPKAPRATRLTRQSKNWQDYLQDPFRQTSLPVAITTVFEQQPKQLLSVPDLINTIFVAEIPQDVRNKARDRMLNILSTGAKDGQWYRGKKGQYSLSKAAAESSR